MFQTAAAVADQAGLPIYAVGGLVRDLLLRTWHEDRAQGAKPAPDPGPWIWSRAGSSPGQAPIRGHNAVADPELPARPDVDLVVEGNGLQVARALAFQLQGKIRIHQWYGTAVLLLPEGLRVDVATARKERYERPAAPPQVEPGTIRDDLYRRDFSINALAIRLNGPEVYRLVDLFGGLEDLAEGLIRVLHCQSFIDDPSRIFRAIRFEQRFGFALEELTRQFLQEAIEAGWVGHLSGAKLWLELTYLLRERSPRENIRRVSELGLSRFIHPRLTWTGQSERRFSQAEEVLSWYQGWRLDPEDGRKTAPLLYLLAWMDGLADPEVQEVCQRLVLPPEAVRILQTARRKAPVVAEALAQADDLSPSQLDHLLSPLPLAALLWLGVQAPAEKVEKVRHSLARYLTELRVVEPFLRGRDLVALGLKPGPRFREILNRIRESRLNGILKTQEDEIQFVKEHYL
ncbi:MAG: CCA tRNA nucleotidyltransferase [Candidatus Tectomicrobia bacterium]|uniref:CCA tRNA nucleotidyltransferase n=1 Tax=Tectimicrobiota bacterium TaxID=2528274 RepID=A0A932FV17_UNCTE|nr:CCA tRNA nucleotidyltransferase [Candidatus Tectomicrobia bacterium]